MNIGFMLSVIYMAISLFLLACAFDAKTKENAKVYYFFSAFLFCCFIFNLTFMVIGYQELMLKAIQKG